MSSRPAIFLTEDFNGYPPQKNAVIDDTLIYMMSATKSTYTLLKIIFRCHLMLYNVHNLNSVIE
jgi:hypothetical protein